MQATQATAKPARFCSCTSECAASMKVLSEAARLDIVRALLDGPRHVAAIAQATSLAPARVSHHLGRMRLAGIVACERDGQTMVYRIAPRIAAGRSLDLGCCRITFRPL